MEFNSKLRGQKHHSNKARYQNKVKVVSKVVPETKSKEAPKESPEKQRGLTSNWHRYEGISDDDTVDEATNFSLLAQAPISHGGHFQFKSDKGAETEGTFESLRENKMFALDLCLLQTSLNTIPFNERCGLGDGYLTNSRLEEIEKRSQQNKVQYESYLKINSIAKDFVSQSISNDSSKSERVADDRLDDVGLVNSTEAAQPYLEEIVNASQDILEAESGKISVNTEKSANLQHNSEEDKEDLEQWLDDILSD